MNANDEDENIYGNLPKGLIQCLKLCGYDSDAALSMLKNVSEVEEFLRNNGDFFKNVAEDEAKCAYGIFFNATDKFQFLPAHKGLLEAFIEKRKSNAISEKSKTVRKKSSESERKKSSSESELLDASTDENVIQEKVMKTWKSIKNNLTNWCRKQDSPLNELQEDVHYSLTVTATGCKITCMMCGKVCKIGKTKGLYIISNYTRHMLKTCTYLKERTNLKEIEVDYSSSSVLTSNTEEEIESIRSTKAIANGEEVQTTTELGNQTGKYVISSG